MNKEYEKITTAEEILENQITLMKYKIEHPYDDMDDEHLLLLYKVNLLLFEENQKEIKGEIETTKTDKELIQEKREIAEMLKNEHDELRSRKLI